MEENQENQNEGKPQTSEAEEKPPLPEDTSKEKKDIPLAAEDEERPPLPEDMSKEKKDIPQAADVEESLSLPDDMPKETEDTPQAAEVEDIPLTTKKSRKYSFEKPSKLHLITNASKSSLSGGGSQTSVQRKSQISVREGRSQNSQLDNSPIFEENLPFDEEMKKDEGALDSTTVIQRNEKGSLIRVKQPSSTEEDPDYRITQAYSMEEQNMEMEVFPPADAVKEEEPDEKPQGLKAQTVAQEMVTAAVKDRREEKQVPSKVDKIRLAEVVYKKAARVIQDPTVPVNLRICRDYIPGASVRGANGGSNRQVAEMFRREAQEYRHACKRLWQPNPACTVPMRVRRYGRRSAVKPTPAVEEWRILEERDKERRDHELAKQLGYETLVGNLLYIDIPGGKEINRSWQNFLSQNEMEWGFPYEKGSIERPRMKQPEPYLAHQVKEKLWKFPRSRTFQTAPEE